MMIFNLTALGSRKGCLLKRSIWQSAVVQTHKSGTLSDFTKLNLTSVSHCCLAVQVLLHCSTYNLQFEVAGILYDVLLEYSPSSFALLPPQKSRLVSSNSSLATTARLHTATSRPSRLEQTNRLTNPPTTQTLPRSEIMTLFNGKVTRHQQDTNNPAG